MFSFYNKVSLCLLVSVSDLTPPEKALRYKLYFTNVFVTTVPNFSLSVLTLYQRLSIQFEDFSMLRVRLSYCVFWAPLGSQMKGKRHRRRQWIVKERREDGCGSWENKKVYRICILGGRDSKVVESKSDWSALWSATLTHMAKSRTKEKRKAF